MGCSHSFANELFLKSYEEEPPASIKSTVATRVWGSVRWHDCVCGAAGESEALAHVSHPRGVRQGPRHVRALIPIRGD